MLLAQEHRAAPNKQVPLKLHDFVPHTACPSLQIPTQTYFIPLPERDLFEKTFELINPIADGNVNSIVAISISTTNTVGKQEAVKED